MSCGCGKPKCDGKCGISPAVLQINNNDCTLFHKVEVPAAMGDETTNPPKNGAYRNVLLYYAASGNSYLYSSDGIPTKLTGVVSDYEVLTNKPSINDVVLIGNKTLADLGITSAIDNAVGAEASARTEADNALSDRINSNASSISSVSARVSANTTAINNEKTARENADTALSNRINAVKTTADSAVQPDDIDYTVMTDVDVSANSSTSMVELEGSKVNLKTGITSSKQVSLPVASSTEAGVMNSSTFDAVTSNTNNINAILSGAVAITGLSANPTQAQLTTAWQNETGLSTLINRASIYDVTNSKVWTYYTNDTTWHATESASTITINQFTNSSLGTIKGSTNVGQIFAENDGTGSVNGWDSLSSTVTNATNKLSGIQDGAEVNVQSDWEVTDNTSDAFIKNKPTIPTKTSQLENDSGFIVNDTHQVCSEGGDITLDRTTLEPLVFNHLSGETSQNGTPTPDAPVPVQTVTGENVVKITGKNLLEYKSRFTPYSNYGITTTMDATTGIITINGTFTGTSAKDIPLINNSVSINISQNNSYYIGIKYISGSKTGDPNFTARTVLSSGSYYLNNAVPLVHEDRSVLCNINNAVRFDTIRFFVPIGATFDNYKVLPYINANEAGYEPYQGQSYEVNLGKNLFDVQDATGTRGDNTVVASSQTITLNSSTSGTETSFYLNDVSQIGRYLATSASVARDYKITGFGGSYTLRITLANIPSGSGPLVWCAFTNKRTLQYTRSDISDNKITKTITLSDDEYFKSVQFYTADTNVFSGFTMTVQLEKGSTATSYAAFFTPIELCKIGDYQDYIYKSGDKWYVRKEVGKYVADGDTEWTKSQYGTNNYSCIPSPVIMDGSLSSVYSTVLIKSNCFVGVSYNDRIVATDNIAYSTSLGANNAIYVRNIPYGTVEALTNFCASNNPVFYYALATPTDTEITNESLIEQLEELWEADGVEGQTNIFSIYADGNEQMQISVCQYPSHLPIATTSQLGTVIVGHGLTIEEDGRLDVVVDDALSATSIHPVENRAVYEAIEGLSPYTAGDHIDITDNTISAVDYVHSENPVSITTPGSTVSGSELTDGSVTFDKTATGEFLKLQLTTTDPGEGAALADNTLLGVYQ